VPYDAGQPYEKIFPLRQVRRIKSPTLILHGEMDQGISVSQAREFCRGLIEMGVKTELVIYQRESHGIFEPKHQLDLLRRVLNWFDKFLR